MNVTSNDFIPMARIALTNDELRASVDFATTTAYSKRLDAMFEAGREHGEALRRQAARAKRRALSRLPDLLEQAEANLKANGAQVLWAETAGRLIVWSWTSSAGTQCLGRRNRVWSARKSA
jgi:L-lactate dehydrogenase complex protein LldF